MNRRELLVGALTMAGAALVPDWVRPAEAWVARESPVDVAVLALRRTVWQPGTVVPAQYEARYCGRLLPDRYFVRNGSLVCDPRFDRTWLWLRLQPLRLKYDQVTGWYGADSLRFQLPDPEVTIEGAACDGAVFAPERLQFWVGDPETYATSHRWNEATQAKLTAMRPLCLRERLVSFEELAAGKRWELLQEGRSNDRHDPNGTGCPDGGAAVSGTVLVPAGDGV